MLHAGSICRWFIRSNTPSDSHQRVPKTLSNIATTVPAPNPFPPRSHSPSDSQQRVLKTLSTVATTFLPPSHFPPRPIQVPRYPDTETPGHLDGHPGIHQVFPISQSFGPASTHPHPQRDPRAPTSGMPPPGNQGILSPEAYQTFKETADRIRADRIRASRRQRRQEDQDARHGETTRSHRTTTQPKTQQQSSPIAWEEMGKQASQGARGFFWFLGCIIRWSFGWLKYLLGCLCSLLPSLIRFVFNLGFDCWLKMRMADGGHLGVSDVQHGAGAMLGMWWNGGDTARQLVNLAVQLRIPLLTTVASLFMIASGVANVSSPFSRITLPSIPSMLEGFPLGWTGGSSFFHTPPPPVETPPTDTSNGPNGYIEIIPTLRPEYGTHITGLDSSGESKIANFNDVAMQVWMQVSDTNDHIVDLLADVDASPSERLAFFPNPAAWSWSWVAGDNPVARRAAALSAIAQSASVDRANVASQIQRLFDQDFAPALSQCPPLAKQGASWVNAVPQQLRQHDARVAEAEAKAGLLPRALQVLTGISPLSRELQVQLEEAKVAVKNQGRKDRLDAADTIGACTVLELAQRVVENAVWVLRSDQTALDTLAQQASSIRDEAGRRAWGQATAGTVQRWDKSIVKNGQRYLNGVKGGYRRSI
ncbi:hypothetical protein QBC39DRAFT_365407 [Podospora conica]|nr:hypothetical protein QBC39DRAFT_365407 [Schizothecium conicum]